MAVILEFNFGNFVDSRYIVDPIIGEDFKAPYRVLQRKTTECVSKIPMIQKNVVNSSRKAVSRQAYRAYQIS